MIKKTGQLSMPILIVMASLLLAGVGYVSAKTITLNASSTDKVSVLGSMGIALTGGAEPTSTLDVNGSLQASNSITFRLLAGTGTRLVLADANGALSASTLQQLTVPAGVVKAGTFGSAVGGGNFTFPGDLTITNNIRIGAGVSTPVTLTMDYRDGYPYIQAQHDYLLFVGSPAYVFDNKVAMGTSTGAYTLSVGGGVQATQYYYWSDRDLKTDIQPLEGSLSKVLQLQGVTYRWKDDKENDGVQMGLIAQDVEGIFPAAVGKGEPKSISYGSLIAPLIEAIKEQQTEIDDLKVRVRELERR